MGSIFAVDDLYVTLGETAVLRSISLAIAPGRFIGLLGPNGSGKTTFLRTLSGLLPYSGSVRFDGTEISSWSRRALARRLAFVRQFQSLPFDFTVEELVLLGRTPHKHWLEGYDGEDFERAGSALAELEVLQYRARSVQEVSGGELQRVLLAQALVQQADVLLLDEPTAHLDVHHQYSFLRAVRGFVDRGLSAIAVFHDLELASRFADDLLVLDAGALYASGSPRTVLSSTLLNEVFRMEARVESDAAGFLKITYLRPTGIAQTSAV